MQIDPRMVAWDDAGPNIDPRMVAWDDKKLSRTDRVLTGIADPVHGGAQLLTKVLPDVVVQKGNALNNWLADKTGLVAKLPEGGVDQQVRERETAYQQARGDTGLDGYRLIGNVLSPANAAVASRAAAAPSLLGRVAAGAKGGAIVSALAPVTSGDFAEEKTKQVGTGAVFGGLVPIASEGVARVVSPIASKSKQLALLKSEGVKPTVGQALGGWANRAEEKAQSIPIVGDAIAAARQRATGDLNTAVANRALFPLNKKLPKDVTGNDAVLYVRKALSEAYDDVMPKLAVQQDKAYQQSVADLQKAVSQGAINPNAKSAFNRFLKNEVNPLFQGQKAMTGETFKRLQSKITEEVQRTGASTDADQRLLNGAYKELGDQLNQLSIRTNPQAAAKLKAINTGYANFKRMQKAASSVAAEDGVFSAAQLHNAVKAADRSKDKARFAEGGALMQDLSAAGKNLLSNKVPDSGTAGRVALGAGALATGAINPLIPAPLLGGALMYTPAMQQALAGLVSARPAFADPAANMLRKAAPALAPGGAYLGLGLLNQP
jgi:hypothetical protein